MPVFVVRGDKADTDPKSGKPYRHVNPGCSGYTKHPDSTRSGPVRNTQALRESTVRCPLAGDWDVWEKEQQLMADKRKARGAKAPSAAGGKTSASKAASAPAQKQGGKAADLAKRARQKPATKRPAAKGRNRNRSGKRQTVNA